MPGPAVPRHDHDARPAVLSSSATSDLAALGELHDVAGDLRDRCGDHCGVRRGRSPAAAATSRPFCRAVTTSASRLHRHPDLVVLRRLAVGRRSGQAERRAEVAVQQVPGTSSSPLTPAVARGQRDQHRPAPVGRRLRRLLRQQVLHPQLAPGVRLSWAATAPGVEPRPAASVAVSYPPPRARPAVSRSARRQPRSAAPTTPGAPLRSTSSSGRGAGVGSASRCALRRAAVLLAPCEAMRLRAVTIAYGTSASGSSRARAPIIRASVSWTRSSTRCGSRIRAATTRRTTGTRSRIASSSPPTGAAPSSPTSASLPSPLRADAPGEGTRRSPVRDTAHAGDSFARIRFVPVHRGHPFHRGRGPDREWSIVERAEARLSGELRRLYAAAGRPELADVVRWGARRRPPSGSACRRWPTGFARARSRCPARVRCWRSSSSSAAGPAGRCRGSGGGSCAGPPGSRPTRRRPRRRGGSPPDAAAPVGAALPAARKGTRPGAGAGTVAGNRIDGGTTAGARHGHRHGGSGRGRIHAGARPGRARALPADGRAGQDGRGGALADGRGPARRPGRRRRLRAGRAAAAARGRGGSGRRSRGRRRRPGCGRRRHRVRGRGRARLGRDRRRPTRPGCRPARSTR